MISYLVLGLLTGSAYALLALAFVLVYKGTRIFNLAQGEIGGIGLYVAWSLTSSLPVPLASLAGIAVSALLGLLLERTVVRRVVDRTPLAGLAATLGVALTLAYLEGLVWKFNIKTYPPLFGLGSVQLAGVTVTYSRLAALGAAAAVGAGLALFLSRTRFGLAVRAATSDQALARASGVRVDLVRSVVWALAGGVSGLVAILLAVVYTFHPLSNTFILVRAMAAALVGGMTSLTGALLGGIAVGLVESLVVWTTGVGGAMDTAVFLLILLVLLLRPGGILGGRQA